MEQASESVQYCSRCGFKLNDVNHALPRRLLAIVMFLLLTMSAFFGWGSAVAGPEYGMIRMFITVIAAIAFYLLFFDDLKRIPHKRFSRNNESAKQITSASFEPSLPPARSIPVPTPASRRINTAEMVQPPSVTEQTTNLLGRQPESR
jgi:hypothetical protein